MSHPANSLLRTSDAGLALIKVSEGLEIEAYPDPGNRVTGEPWTIGYGHTRGVRRGDTCTEEQATEWLREDLHDAEAAVRRLVDVHLTQGQFDALTSLRLQRRRRRVRQLDAPAAAQCRRRRRRRGSVQALESRRGWPVAWPGHPSRRRARAVRGRLMLAFLARNPLASGLGIAAALLGIWGGWQYLGRVEAEKALAAQQLKVLQDANDAWSELDDKRQAFEREILAGLAALRTTVSDLKAANTAFAAKVQSNANSRRALDPVERDALRLLAAPDGDPAGGGAVRTPVAPSPVR